MALGKKIPEMAVVIQLQIDSSSSGVLFTLNPTTGCVTEMVIESCWGLGEGVVCGEITPNRFIVDWSSEKVIQKQTPSQKKKFAFVCCSGSERKATKDEKENEKKKEKKEGEKEEQEYVCLQSTSDKEAITPSLSDDQALMVAKMGVYIATYYGHPQVRGDSHCCLLEYVDFLYFYCLCEWEYRRSCFFVESRVRMSSMSSVFDLLLDHCTYCAPTLCGS